MTSNPFISFSKVKSILPSFTSRQTTPGDGSQSSGKQLHYFKTISRSSTPNLIAGGNTEPNSDHVTGQTPPLEDSPPTAQPQTINVVLFGETGVGKSSVINLIARREIAKVSSNVTGCTMASTRYDIPFDDTNFAIFDTIGLEEPQMGVNGYLKAIEKTYELIVKLGAAGGIHLLLFCMRGGRITATTQSNYRLFCECLCSTRVPIALVFTYLEREEEMENWWTRNKTHIEYYGIKSDGHVCITAVKDDTPGEDLKYTESQRRIRELLKSCALKNNAFLPVPQTWFAKIGRDMRSFIEKHRNPKKKDVVSVLTRRCKLDRETAKKIADMMEKSDTEAKDGDNTGGEGQSDPKVGADGRHGSAVPEDNAASHDEPPNQPGDIKVESHVDEKDRNAVPKEDPANDVAPLNQPGDVKARPNVDWVEGNDENGEASDDTPLNQSGDVVAEPRADMMEGEGGSKALKENAANDNTPPNQLGDVKTELGVDGMGKNERKVAKKSMAQDYILSNQLGGFKTKPPRRGIEGKDGREIAKRNMVKDDPLPKQQLGADGIDEIRGKDERDMPKQNAAKDHPPSKQPGDVKAWPGIDGKEGEDAREIVKRNVAKDDVLSNQYGDIKVEPRIHGGKARRQHKKYGNGGHR